MAAITELEYGTYLDVNDKFMEVSGFSRENILGKTSIEVGWLRAEDRRRLIGALQTQGKFPGMEVTSYAKGGRPVECFYHCQVVTIRGVNRLLTMVLDLTERKRVEQEAAKLAAIVKSSDDAIIGKNPDGVITSWNRGAEKIYGYAESEIVGKPISILIPPGHEDDVPQILAKIKSGETIHHYETVRRRKDGQEINVSLTVSPIRNDQGGIVAASTIGRDITEGKRAEAERSQMEQRLKELEKAESLGRMAGSIAHLFNNKLGAVIGNLELALYDVPQEADVRASIVEAMKTSQQAAEVSQMMLAYLGQTIGRNEPLDLVETVRESLRFSSASTPQHVHLETDYPSMRPIILGNNAHIRQILTNLVSNAAEAIDQNEGDITVAIQVTQRAEVRGLRFSPIDWEPKAEQYVCLSVSDTGGGMDQATQKKVFDPFFSTKFTGRGLGLSVLLGLVRAHDGAITVLSSPGRGTTFRVFFPLHTLEAVPPLKEEPLTSKLVEKGGLVLLVDDAPEIRKMVTTMLKRMGYEVLAASGGAEAVKLFEENPDGVRFVITDLTMTGMDGWETLTALRKIRPDIPVILASGHDEAHAMGRDYADRPDVFLHKPYSMGDFKSAIDKVLQKAVSVG